MDAVDELQGRIHRVSQETVTRPRPDYFPDDRWRIRDSWATLATSSPLRV